ncbi:MAG TPA: ArdC-like ssDNA-binding domain-containing protein [Lacipirellulaceae bacterium]|nr:ArdC-like ssDNA-binding domain-containing protein [Lacipirellulaceae bacterium]HMP04725.1 ArdC-like ssDNA-binding domain-containing protein [Lacipirellulaceae bacterium]
MMNTQQQHQDTTRLPGRETCASPPLDLTHLTAPPAPSESPPARTGAELLKLAGDALGELERDLAAGQSATLTKFLATLATFHNYSFSNVMLICLQRPDATHVAGFNAWKKLGRYVKKGEKGIGIIAPMVFGKAPDAAAEDEAPRIRFKVVRVFDVAQTDGEPLAEFASIRGDPGEHLARLRDLVRQRQITLEYDDIAGGAQGVSRGGSITIRPDLAPAEDFAVLVHELAHELLHRKDRRAAATKTQRETEAEAVAFVVSKAVGLDCGSHASDYIQLYQGDAKLLSASLDLIQKTAADILADLLPKTGRQEEA